MYVSCPSLSPVTIAYAPVNPNMTAFLRPFLEGRPPGQKRDLHVLSPARKLSELHLRINPGMPMALSLGFRIGCDCRLQITNRQMRRRNLSATALASRRDRKSTRLN